MKRFEIGPGVPCDLDVLLNTRLLVQANSGAGKSWLLRRLLEQTSGRVQQIVIDPEGEFATLRERFDYVLAAKTGGDTLAHPRAAKLLAERLLELGVSAVLDIYELKAHERVQFVKVFLEALVDAPKRLWHPVLVVLDEAHVFAPEKGSAESLQAVIDLATRGRKRGYSLIQATQRLSKLHKDAAAEMNNKLIGRSALDVDMERAGDELGLTKAGRQVLRDLDSGEFFAFGPALTRTVTRVKVGPVVTSHPKAGSKLAGVVPPPTEKVKAVLSKLADLPAEAEQRERTVAEMKARIAELERLHAQAVRQAQSSQRVTGATAGFSLSSERAKPEVREILTDADRELLRAVASRLTAVPGEIGGAVTARVAHVLGQAVEQLTAGVEKLAATRAAEVGALLDKKGLARILEKLDRVVVDRQPVNDGLTARSNVPARASTPISFTTERKATGSAPAAAAGELDDPQRKILDVAGMLRYRGITPSRDTIARWLDIHPNGGRYGSNLAALRAAGLLEGAELTEAGAALARPMSTGLAGAKAPLDGAQQALIDVLHTNAGKRFTRDTLAAALGIHPNGGRYGSNLARLRVMGLIPERGDIYLTEAAHR